MLFVAEVLAKASPCSLPLIKRSDGIQAILLLGSKQYIFEIGED
jgi:hypothetical protein